MSSLNFDEFFIKVAASSYWQTNKMCWIWKTPPTPIQFRFLLLLWFHHFFLLLPWFSRGHAGVRMLFSDLSGKMMSLHPTSLGHSPLCQGAVRADPQLVLQRSRPDMQKGPITFMLLFKALKSIDEKQAKSTTHRKGRSSFLFASLFPFPEKYLPSLQAIVRVWTHMMIALRRVCKYSTDLEGDLCFKSSPLPVAWWEGVEKGTTLFSF